jgi:type IV pilus assembly protein PilC
MKKFKYKARDVKGKAISGEVQASSAKLAAKLLRNKDLVVISVKPFRELPIEFIKNLRNRSSGYELTNFTRQLATMINAGLPITDSLLILRSQVSGVMQDVAQNMLSDVQEGESLSKAMSKYQNIFPKTYIALIRSGEVGGVLDNVLLRLADNLEKEREFRGKIRAAMVYPSIIIFGMIAVAFIMLTFVIPRLTQLYSQFEADLPWTTILLIGVSNFMSIMWPFILIGTAIGAYALKVYSSTAEGRRKIDDFLFKVPFIGDLQKKIILTELTRTLSLMVGSGVSILEALTIASNVVGNKIVSDALDDAAKMVEKGFPVAYAFSKHSKVFPFILSQMVAVGEETGKMDEVLAKVSHVFEVESDQKVKALTSAVEPAILLILGVGVGYLVISIILPIYNLTAQF